MPTSPEFSRLELEELPAEPVPGSPRFTHSIITGGQVGSALAEAPTSREPDSARPRKFKIHTQHVII